MERDDVQLIRNILSGDDKAFSTLVEKYQKSVHALAWRKIGDFHLAEEITQDTFLQVYKKLSTLKNPKQFSGWLYVIANRLCLNWIRKKKHAMQSLDSTSTEEIEKLSHARHTSAHRETEATERRNEIVQKLLARLPESERTVVTLHYLGEMKIQEISKFLGVSVNTIHSRLHRAKKRLQAKEELLIHEVLGGVQLPTNLIESIMQQVADIKPTAPTFGKPLLPWAAFGAATVLIILLLGASNQYLARFQQPYSFEAQSEPTIEIVDAPVVLNIDAKPAVQNQFGRVATLGKSNSLGLQTAKTVLTSDTQEDAAKFSASRWTRTNGPYGGNVCNIFATSERVLYAATRAGIYRREVDATAWTLINTAIPTNGFRMPMAEHGDTLYIVSADNIFTSIDNGETWHVFCSRPKGHPIGFVIMDETDGDTSRSRIVMYLAIQNKGIFRSTDAATQWNLIENGLTDTNIYALTAIHKTLFAGTDAGLYSFNSGTWQKLPTSPSGAVYAVTGFENNIYVEMSQDSLASESIASRQKSVGEIMLSRSIESSRTFHSTNLGASWTEIIHKNKPDFSTARGRVILVYTADEMFEMILSQGPVAVDKNTFYKTGLRGIYRTTDGGESWHLFTNGIMERTIQNLVTLNNNLYVYTGTDLVQSTDNGEAWKTVTVDSGDRTLKAIRKEPSDSNFHLVSQVATAGDALYGIVRKIEELRVFQLSASDNVIAPVPEAPTFKQDLSLIELGTGNLKQARLSNNREKNDSLLPTLHFVEKQNETGGFAVTGQTFYAEWKRRLVKWNRGDSEWTNTGLIDTTESPKGAYNSGFKLAASGEVVYVGKRDGTLFQSLDGGNNWKNITPTLPLRFTHFKEIVFASSTIYVATDGGVLVSQNGEHWRVLTDSGGARVVIDKFAVNHTRVYGADDASVYRLDAHGKWEQIFPSVPDKIISLATINDRLYIATQRRGIFHISLEEGL